MTTSATTLRTQPPLRPSLPILKHDQDKEDIMSKAWHGTKEPKKQPTMTPKERRAAKNIKKHSHETPPIVIIPH